MFWRKKETALAEDRWLVIGLGNPGPKYEQTRHNVGQMALDQIAQELSESFKSHKTNSRIAVGRLRVPGPQLILMKPNTFMNLSGGPASQSAKYFDVPVDRIIVLHDELDVPFGNVKLKQGGGHGGHNGLRDITKALGTPDFLRVRIGIGRPTGSKDPADFVLSPFNSTEKKELDLLLADAADATSSIVFDGLLKAQQDVHSRNKA